MALEDYREKRDFEKTREPEGGEAQGADHRFVVHEHHATRLHFDLRLEMEGVLKSWAIPKGPSMNPADKRLAMMVEDHPLDYITFRGEIAEGNYGAGEVEIWDSGTYEVTDGTLEAGKMVFELFGTRLHGQFALVKLKRGKNEWLLIKHGDEYADPNWKLEQILPGGSRKERKELESKEEGSKGGSLTVERPRTEIAADPMPETISPMLATLVEKPFSDPQWLFEVKWDGYRAISFIRSDSFRFASRRDENMIDRFPQADAIPGLIEAQTAILDGEIVVVDATGKPNFQLLQNVARIFPSGRSDESKGTLVYYVFDLLYLNGEDLRDRALIERKKLLQSIVHPNDFMKYSDHLIERGEALFEQARASDLEGIVAKRMDSPYLEKRSNYWLKIKNVRRQELVIGGYTQPRRSREGFGSLVVGVYEGDSLVFAGQVGGGFDDATLRQVYEMLQPLRTDKCPFKSVPKTNEPAVWVRPELVCEAKFAEWTEEGILRQPVFLGMRVDKSPRDVVREKPKEVEAVVETKPKSNSRKQRAIPAEEFFQQENLKGDACVDVDGVEVSLSHLDKVYWPDDGYTKGELLRYYYKVRETIVPYLKDRPLILRRWPNGIKEESFYQHNLEDAPEWVRRVPIEEEGSTVNYAVIDDAASLLYIVNLGTISQNPFFSLADSLDRPDYIALDLDPEYAPFSTVCEVAMVVKQVLDDAGLDGYAKSSGSRGMHVFVPIAGLYSYEQAQRVGEIIANLVAYRSPKIATVERMTKNRDKDQVYVDYLQNSLGKSITAAYSVRECPGARVSTPLTWEEIAAKPDMRDFTMFTVPERIEKIGDIYRPTLSNKQKLSEPIKRLEKLLAEVKK